MLEKQILIKCLKIDYGIEAASVTLLPIGADIHAAVYRVEAVDGTPYFVKLKQGDFSAAIIELLQRVGIQQIILPIRTVHGKATQPIEDCTLVVYPFITGHDGFSRTLTDEQWMELGKALRQVHAVAVPSSIPIRKEIYSPKWRDAVRSLYGSDAQFMQENMPAIQRLVERAELLSEKLQSEAPLCVLCHSDIHAGNVLLEENGALYIVDWDEPILAPKERDLMFIGGGVGNVWNNPHEEALFYQGYGKTDVDRTILAYYRNERIVEDIAVYAHELLLKDNPKMLRHFLDMFEPRGVVEIALKT
jgi:spectinomycin phosphotransferase